MNRVDIAVIGGGPAGLAAAIEAKKAGVSDILVLERDRMLGGILNQCIHNGFGLHTFNEELTGPEYAQRFIDQALALGVPYRLGTMVMDIQQDPCGSDKIVTYMNHDEGLVQLRAGAVILAMGCRERPRGALNIPGFRPAGIYTAGTAQRLVNMEGFMPGRKVVILGSGDIGLIMARRMTLEGAQVQVVAELMPYSGGLKRNIVQCLDDFGIPLKLSHTVVNIEGRKRVEAVTIAEVDEKRRPIPGTEERYECDTLLLSCGLIPENELTRSLGAVMSPVTKGPEVNESLETSVGGVFACGNVLHVHDLVDFVSQEASQAGRNAARYIRDRQDQAAAGSSVQSGAIAPGQPEDIRVSAEGGVRYTVPEVIGIGRMEDTQTIRFRVGAVYRNRYESVYVNDTRIFHRKRKIMAPGEMETVVLKKEAFSAAGDVRKITVTLEDE